MFPSLNYRLSEVDILDMWLDRILSSPLPNERVILYLRRHWFTFFIEVIRYLLLLLIPLLFAWLVNKYLPERWFFLFDGGLKEIIIELSLSIYYFGIWVFFWTSWTDFYLDVWIVTNERIIAVEQRGLFNRSRSELRLSRVEDVTCEVKGLFATLFHYGDVTIQTAGMEQNSIFRKVPQAYAVTEQIVKLVDSWRKNHINEPTPDH